MILYEYPFNESIRTMLRLEHLFDRLAQLLPPVLLGIANGVSLEAALFAAALMGPAVALVLFLLPRPAAAPSLHRAPAA